MRVVGGDLKKIAVTLEMSDSAGSGTLQDDLTALNACNIPPLIHFSPYSYCFY